MTLVTHTLLSLPFYITLFHLMTTLLPCFKSYLFLSGIAIIHFICKIVFDYAICICYAYIMVYIQLYNCTYSSYGCNHNYTYLLRIIKLHKKHFFSYFLKQLCSLLSKGQCYSLELLTFLCLTGRKVLISKGIPDT